MLFIGSERGRQASIPAINDVTLSAGNNVLVSGTQCPTPLQTFSLMLAGPVVVLIVKSVVPNAVVARAFGNKYQ